MVKITHSFFVTVVFHYFIVGYVAHVYTRYLTSPLRMVQSLQA